MLDSITGSRRFLVVVGLAWLPAVLAQTAYAVDLKIATFQIDATPPLGSPLCSGFVAPAVDVDDPLSARGLILLPAGQQPIVLVAVDWVGIGNGGQDAWREELARAAGTDPSRVAVHTLHQHDAPGCDFTSEAIAAEHGLSGEMFDVAFVRETIDRAAGAARKALEHPQEATHLGLGRAKVEKVASNRRLLGPDGKVKHVRYSSCKDPAVRALPEGTIDPWVRVVSFFNNDDPLVVVSYYATHPQSYYGQGRISADFVGLARTLHEEQLPGVQHLHFNGAGGNVAAGKYNDGSPPMRKILSERLAKGIGEAWKATEKTSLASLKLRWQTVAVELPAAHQIETDQCLATLENEDKPARERLRAARDLAWLRRSNEMPIELSRLELGPLDVLHLPGELFVEYQLAAQQMQPQRFVCTAAYGDYGPGYIGLEHSYAEGGYETSYVSRVSPRVETVLTRAISELMNATKTPTLGKNNE